MEESKQKQLEQAEGRVDRPFYAEDLIHRNLASQMLSNPPTEFDYNSLK